MPKPSCTAHAFPACYAVVCRAACPPVVHSCTLRIHVVLAYLPLLCLSSWFSSAASKSLDPSPLVIPGTCIPCLHVQPILACFLGWLTLRLAYLHTRHTRITEHRHRVGRKASICSSVSVCVHKC